MPVRTNNNNPIGIGVGGTGGGSVISVGGPSVLRTSIIISSSSSSSPSFDVVSGNMTSINNNNNIGSSSNNNINNNNRNNSSSSIGNAANNSHHNSTERNRWVTVSWMPHASLSQTSHVAVAVRSIVVTCGLLDDDSDVDDDVLYDNPVRRRRRQYGSSSNDVEEDWQVQVTVHGIAGLALVPVPSFTPMAPLIAMKNKNRTDRDHNNNVDDDDDNDDDDGAIIGSDRDVEVLLRPSTTIISTSSSSSRYLPSSSASTGDNNRHYHHHNDHRWVASVSNAAYTCQWNSVVHIPLRWRDLPRDAYLQFVITKSSYGTKPLYEASLPLFDTYGKLQTGLTRLRLHTSLSSTMDSRRERTTTTTMNSSATATTTTINPGLLPPPKRTDPSYWQGKDSDPVWKASLMLDRLDRFHDGGDRSRRMNIIHPGGSGIGSDTQASSTMTTTSGGSNSNSNPVGGGGGGGGSGGSTTMGTKTAALGDIPSVLWLDKLARNFCMETLREAEAKSEEGFMVVLPNDNDDGIDGTYSDGSPPAYLIVELPIFDVPVMHEETFYPTPQQGPSGSVTPLDLALHHQRQKASTVLGATNTTTTTTNTNNTGMKAVENTQKDIMTMTAASSIKATSSHSIQPMPFHPLDAIPFLDYEDENDSPIDDKYRTLAHDLLRGLVDPALKPDRVQRDKLAAIIASPSHHPTREEKDLLWRFRFSLVDNRRALTKFLLAVDWTVESEVVQAAELLEQWRKRSPIEVTDALKLLGKQVAYQTNLVRAYAIDTLASAPDAELNLYLLQLVQALKFENIQETTANSPGSGTTAVAATTTRTKSSLATFLLDRASRNVLLANYLYWYLKVELQDPAHGARYREIFDELKQTLSRTPFPTMIQEGSSSHNNSSSGSFLGNRSTPYVDVTTPNEADGFGKDGSTGGGGLGSSSMSIAPFNKIVESVSKFGDKLVRGGTDSNPTTNNNITTDGVKHTPHPPGRSKTRSVWDVLTEQDTFISGIMDVQKSYESKPKQAAKEIHLRTCLAKDGYDHNPNRLAFPLPCAPEIMVNGVIPEKAKVFRSAVYPALIEFNVDYVVDRNDLGTQQQSGHHQGLSGFRKATATTPTKAAGRTSTSSSGSSPVTNRDLSSYRVLMKTGDDLRQDQLVMMMIKLMDGLLKRASLDLCVTPYSIIATSPTSGIVEFVEQSSPVSQILANNNNSILQYFQSCAPQKGAKYNVRPDVISTYVRSVAGGSVITYLMGVGDRHLDNLMITKSGHFFHIDFGFMFGRDPKPLPPAFRLTREMVEGMGGMDSTEYRQFCSLACQAFNALRKSAGLVLNLLHLMSDAGIEDLSNNPSADAEGVIAKVEERFRLDLTDEQAERFFLTLINDSLAAIAPRLMDVFHSIAVARR